MTKTFNNSDVKGARKQVEDLEVFGDGDLFQLICKASSKKEGWMKSTKAMNIAKLGCVIQVTTQQGDQVAEAVCFVPGARIHDAEDGYRCIIKGLVGVRPREISCPECEGDGIVRMSKTTTELVDVSCKLCWGSGKLLAEPVIPLSP